MALKNGETALHDAVTKKAFAAFDKQMARKNIDINARDGNGQTPLMYAAANDQKWAVNNLIELGADIHAVDDEGRNAVHHYVRRERWIGSLLDTLIQAGVNVTAKDINGRTPLHYVVGSPIRYSAHNTMTEHGAEWTDKDNRGETPFLGLGANKNAIRIIERLVERGQHSWDEVDNDGYGLMDRAVSGANVELTKQFLTRAIPQRVRPESWRPLDHRDYVFIHEIIEKDDYEIVNYVISVLKPDMTLKYHDGLTAKEYAKSRFGKNFLRALRAFNDSVVFTKELEEIKVSKPPVEKKKGGRVM